MDKEVQRQLPDDEILKQSRHEIADGSDSEKVNLETLLEFEEVSWPEEERASEESLQQRLADFPEGIAFLYDEDPTDHQIKPMAQLTMAPKQIPENIRSFEEMRDLPVDRSSNSLWGINIGRRVGPEYAGKGYASSLVKDRLLWAQDHGYKIFTGAVTFDRLKEWIATNDQSVSGQTIQNDPQFYFKAAKAFNEQGLNPALNLFKKAAATLGLEIEIGEPIENYWPVNETSLSFGVLIKIHLNKPDQESVKIDKDLEQKPNIEYTFDLSKFQVVAETTRETKTGSELTAFVSLPPAGCPNDCTFCSIKHIKVEGYYPTPEKSINLARDTRRYLEANPQIQTIKLFNCGNIIHGSEWGKNIELDEIYWQSLANDVEDIKKENPENQLQAVEIEVRLDDLYLADDKKRAQVRERILDLEEKLNQTGVELRVTVAIEYLDEQIIKQQRKFINPDNHRQNVENALNFLEEHNISYLIYAMFGGTFGDRSLHPDEATQATAEVVKYAFSRVDGLREVIINCQYLDPILKNHENQAGHSLFYVPTQEDFQNLFLMIQPTLKEANGKRIRISYEAEETIKDSEGPRLSEKFKNFCDRFNNAPDQYFFLETENIET